MATGSMKKQFDDISITLDNGITRRAASGYVAGKLVGFSLEVQLTASVNTWKKLGTITPVPNIITGTSIKAPCCYTGNGSYIGMVEITTSGEIRLYPTTALSSGSIAFSIAYGT